MSKINRVGDMPKGQHYAIITFTSVTIPGDERSRTAPGHGYPEHTEDYCQYLAFTNRAEWEAEVSRLSQDKYNNDKFVAMEVKPANVKTKVIVEIE